ncbi:hypothetical protein QYE76_043417 [Lolium multiflorum]|uniref:Reverse transcriptase/retrotransposon-derived protein RNase H-like domain-containing protein n=1 Tax=Lolium multiflorum TaxID=4521 RepID=A0AAD8TH27_LOLMU|nr:hypothetical protein QYE76_043417 [Lolium multiflorum]
MKPPTTKKELQRLIGKINFVRRFISNLSGRIEPFMGLVKIKSDDEFHWGAEQQRAFDEIKEYLTKPPVLVPPQQDMPFYIYLSVADTSIASVVVQVYDGLEKVVFYLSRRMLDAETRLPTPCTNNVAEYEAIRKGMELLLEAGAEAVELFGDSKLVISQLTEEYNNAEANDLAQMASGYKDVADGADVQNDLTSEEYAALMSDSIEDVTELRLWSLEKIKENKAKETKRGIIHTFLTRYRSGGTPLQFASARDQEALRAVALRDWGQPQP